MSPNVINQFLQNGAFIALPEGEMWLFFAPVEDRDNSANSIIYADFFGPAAKARKFSQKIRVSRQEIVSLLTKNFKLEAFSPSWQAPSLELFELSFREIIGRILRGEIEKAVPVIRTQAEHRLSLAEKAFLLASALSVKSQSFPYGLWDEQSGLIGVTPEILFHRRGESLLTMALAGTCPKIEADRRPHLLKDQKEIAEHQLVVKDICERLKKWGQAQVSGPLVLELTTLFHLKSEIQLLAHNFDDQELMLQLHPTAALGVYPRNYGLQWMKNLPYQKDRGVFGGPILFPLAEDQSLCLVAIRNLMWDQGQLLIHAGCGLVKDSQMPREWDELLAKVNSVKSTLGIPV
ncbi:MAG: chorismate-binding protein [Proteobacteria bacterium]|jgi:menaquinone-specific isochorismate synthase|nr:chorismate-binding protein [Pseudomonadota bacterium]